MDTAKNESKLAFCSFADNRRTGCPSWGGIRRVWGEVPGRNQGSDPNDEPVGQRWGKVESALWRRRRSHSLTAPRCLRSARYGRFMR